ncbi:hypothetical protein OsI_04265 [Oryza sativa Indica Group]|uniref:Alpha/beta hydrolase fold-3 domain-containing protein n=1 Tax=Oryza sativa subsp. indica TaxID=39946 RepID=A2WWI6_ORYSI|nr:hypothetical protein OsI_04265 [Oryza sativa Indica Group]
MSNDRAKEVATSSRKEEHCGCKRKLIPVILYLHNGRLVIGSVEDALEHELANRLYTLARVLMLSFNYCLVLEHPIPACYDDGWSTPQSPFAIRAMSADPRWWAFVLGTMLLRKMEKRSEEGEESL